MTGMKNKFPDNKPKVDHTVANLIGFMIVSLILACTVTACAAQAKKPEKEKTVARQEKNRPSKTRAYRSERKVEIESPAWEEPSEEKTPVTEATAPEPEPVAISSEPEPVAISSEPEPVALSPEPDAKDAALAALEEATSTEPAPAQVKQEDPFEAMGGSAWEDEFVKDMEGIKKNKMARDELTEDLSQTFPLADEILMGEGVGARVLAQTPELDHSALWEYVSFVGLSLAEHALRNDLAYYFIVLDAPEDINAFAAPGGFIFITTGAIRLCQNEAELAAILAHEIGHIGQRHGIKMLDLSKYRMMMKGIVSEMDDAFGKSEFFDLDASLDPRFKQVEKELSSVADQCFNQLLNPFSHDMEFEADLEGLKIMKAAGYDPHAAIDLLERLRAKAGDIPAYEKALHSHPPTAERIAGMKKIVKKHGLARSGRLQKIRFERSTDFL